MMTPKIIKKEYQSGFKAEIILKPHFYQRFFGIIVDFGSSDPQKVAGSAHFLEHKLFAKKDGDLSTQFEDIGADVNAFTSFNETMFYCSGIEHTPKMIDLLFELVGQPYFTKENIAQEAPIIEQELAMYQDDPTWSVNNAIMHDMFACGDFSDNQVQTILRQVGKLQQKYLHGKGKSTAEKQVSFRMLHDQVLPARGNSNSFGLGIRFKNFKKVLLSFDLTQILLEIMLESKLSAMGPWFEEMRKKQLLMDSLQISVNYTRQGDFATIFGVSPQAQEVIAEIKRVLTEPIKKNSAEYRFIRQNFILQKKEWLARTARTSNDLSYLAIELIEENLDHENLTQNIAKLQAMNFDQFYDYCQKIMKDSELCSAYLENK
ncbi:MAG: insulinase family protein [Lactobacillus crispatus]|nr:insulinase family protein [Lactobacillus crispatus]